MPKDLILTYATDIDYSSLQRLIISARKVCPPDRVDIVVILNPLGERFAELADKYQVQLFPCNSVWKEIRPYKPLRLFYRMVLAAAGFMDRHPKLFGSPEVCSYVHRIIASPWLYASSQRYTIIEDLLRVRSTYRMVFLTDARDVILQADPFECLDQDKLHVFLQHNEIYGDANVDTAWINNVLGASVAGMLKGKAASCCGTTFGSRQIILDYLEKMTSAILRYQFRGGGSDQVPHNEIIYFNFPSDQLMFHSNTEGVVLTLGGMTVDEVELTEKDVRLQGKVVPVVHMYDRVKEINELFCRLYSDDPKVGA